MTTHALQAAGRGFESLSAHRAVDLRLRGGNRTGARTDNKHLHHNGLIR